MLLLILTDKKFLELFKKKNCQKKKKKKKGKKKKKKKEFRVEQVIKRKGDKLYVK